MAKTPPKGTAKPKKAAAPAKTKKPEPVAAAPKKPAAKATEKVSDKIADKVTAKAVGTKTAPPGSPAAKDLEKKVAAAAPAAKPSKGAAASPAPKSSMSSRDDDDEDSDSEGSSDSEAGSNDDDSSSARVAKPLMSSDEVFTKEELENFRKLLSEERRKLLHKARIAMENGNIALDKDEMYDEVDLASATVEQNLTFRLLDRDRKLLGEIEHALNKIDNGDYGFCEGTGEMIPKRRLELRPWTRHSVKFKEQLERMKKSGRGVADEDEAW